jgi:hypothetical protein
MRYDLMDTNLGSVWFEREIENREKYENWWMNLDQNLIKIQAIVYLITQFYLFV